MFALSIDKMNNERHKTRLALFIATAVIAVLTIAAFNLASMYQTRLISIKYSLTYVVHFLGLIVIAIVYRGFNKHRISYLQSFGVVLLNGVIIAVLVGIAIYVFTTFVNPDMLLNRQELLLKNANNTQEINYIKQMMSPLATALSTTATIAFLSAIHAAFIAIFARRTKEYKV